MAKRIRMYGVTLTGLGLLTLRLVVGLIFIMHGGQKLFVKGMPAVADFLGKLGMAPPEFWAVTLTVAELAGGVALLAGVFTRGAALALGVTMVVAIVSVLGAKGFFLPGYEFALSLLGGTIALALTGPGRFAADHYFGIEP